MTVKEILEKNNFMNYKAAVLKAIDGAFLEEKRKMTIRSDNFNKIERLRDLREKVSKVESLKELKSLDISKSINCEHLVANVADKIIDNLSNSQDDTIKLIDLPSNDFRFRCLAIHPIIGEEIKRIDNLKNIR
jgi:hypothetical protein